MADTSQDMVMEEDASLEQDQRCETKDETVQTNAKKNISTEKLGNKKWSFMLQI